MKLLTFLAFGFFVQSIASAATAPTIIRWTGVEDQDATIAHVIAVVNQKGGTNFTAESFLLSEDRKMAFTRYQRFEQVVGGVPVDGKAIRVWSDLGTGKAVQVEAALGEVTTSMRLGKFASKAIGLTEEKAIQIARDEVMNSDDATVRGIDSKEAFIDGQIARVITIKATHGKHRIAISEITRKVISQDYKEFPDSDMMRLQANVFPIYEMRSSTGEILPRQAATLNHVYKKIPDVRGDIYAPLKTQKYYDTNFSPILGETVAGRAQGYWSMSYIKDQAKKIRARLPLVNNTFQNGLLLQGPLATINIHPDAFKVFQGINFAQANSSALFPNWIDTTLDGQPVSEMIPQSAFAGKPLMSAQEIFTRQVRKLPDNDPATYMNDGFDEIQVYYAINTLMEELQKGGFKDPDLSTRPFNAFLFNPDVAYRDNAFYTDDTINFTTYSPGSQNMARDNSTIWHELGHGVMDRLMGDNITLADTGGLSEGMADFCAAMVIRGVTKGVPFPGSQEFRIINKTGFFLTNEVHDDGESYGGAMKDFLDATVTRDGQAGLAKVEDVILEAMRLTRDHPGLTAKIWFEHILFADSLGRPGVRKPGELAPLILAAINGRNFKMDGGQTAAFTLMNATSNQEVVANSPGSRQKPIKLEIAQDATAHFDITASLKSSDEYKFTYPVTVKVQFNGGPIQGAVHWVGEEQGAKTFTLNSEADAVSIPLDISGKCDAVNRADGSCVDFAYVQVLDPNDLAHPHAKKRFYVQVKNP